jgi:hypothetical protein
MHDNHHHDEAPPRLVDSEKLRVFVARERAEEEWL